MFNRFFTFRTVALLFIYATIFAVSISTAFFLRFENLALIEVYRPFQTFVAALAIKIPMLFFFGQFRGLLRFFHMPDLVRIFFASAISSALLYLVDIGGFITVPRGVILIDFTMSLICLCAFRLSLRIYSEHSVTNTKTALRQHIAIIGAGDTGCSLAADLLAKPNLGITPVLFLDDDKSKHGRTIMGLNVLPIESNILAAKQNYGIDKMIIAMPSAPPHRIGEVAQAIRRLGIPVNIVPSAEDMVTGRVTLSKIRNVEISDILGRPTVQLEGGAIGDLLKNKTVLVTGAGGSIGSELCRQIASKNPSTLVLLEQCEVLMFQIEQDILSRGYGIDVRSVIADVTDRRRMESVFEKYRPDIVFHAAAHKHVPMMEYQPGEALKNNTYGTWLAASLSSKYGVGKFVLISTDKAINPTNVMGATKRLSEMAVRAQQDARGNRTAFAAVRFGNVLGSSGSVIPTFKKQIENGGPVTVTHPEITRYFMTIPEAVGLVLQCGALADGGEIFVLDMGSPMKIIDIARQLIRLSGFEPDVDINIEITGLRPGEKLFEEIQHKSEHLTPTKHPRIFGFASPNPSPEEVAEMMKEILEKADNSEANDLKRLILKYVPEYKAQFYS